MSYDASLPGDNDRDAQLDELRAQSIYGRRIYQRLLANLDCRDPDHPGCINCEGNDE